MPHHLKAPTVRLGTADTTRSHQPTYCQEPECQLITSGRKPFCLEHIHRMPYLANIQEALEREPTDPDGPAAHEILLLLRISGLAISESGLRKQVKWHSDWCRGYSVPDMRVAWEKMLRGLSRRGFVKRLVKMTCNKGNNRRVKKVRLVWPQP